MDFRAPEPPRRPETVLPMVNLVFLLLVFFLMAATLAPPAPVPVEPPRAALDSAAEPTPLRLHLDAAGGAHHGGLAGPAAIAALRAAADGAPVTLHADRAAPGRALAATLTALAPSPVLLVVEPAPTP